MRFRLANPGSENYLHPEAWLNNIKLVPVNDGTELVMGVSPVDSEGNQSGGLALPIYDYVSRTLAPDTTETYIFKQGGSGGTTVATVVVVYTDNTLTDILTVTKT